MKKFLKVFSATLVLCALLVICAACLNKSECNTGETQTQEAD